MKLNEQKISPKQIFIEAEIKSQHEIAEKVMQLFTPAIHPFSIEEKIDYQIAAIIDNFLEISNVNTNTELDFLLEKFGDSKVPVEPSSSESYFQCLNDNVVGHSIHTSSLNDQIQIASEISMSSFLSSDLNAITAATGDI